MTETDLNQWRAEAAKLIAATPADVLPILRAYLEGATAMANALTLNPTENGEPNANANTPNKSASA